MFPGQRRKGRYVRDSRGVSQDRPLAPHADDPPVMVDVPLCTEHFAQYKVMKAEDFFKQHPLKGAL